MLTGRERQLAAYAAEEAALAGSGRSFSGPAEAQRYAAELIGSDWWAQRWPRVDRVAVGPSRSRRLDGYVLAGTVPQIRLSRWREAVLLHELAHVVTGPDHDAAFVEALLALVRHRMGFHAYGALRHALPAGSPADEVR